MPRIRVLCDALVNQIAAGEVVERPASVVKELLENALDAGAASVRIRLAGGGRDLVEVGDDGCGMDADDALLALERHATSKIASVNDLERISTLGFRGEALPSIAAVARLTLETAPVDGEGTRVEVSFGRILRVQPCSRPRGTRVTIEELFAHLPARRKFLRAEGTELRHAVAVASGFAFVRPDVALRLEHGRRTLLELPAAADFARRLPDLLGAARARAARPVRHTAGGIEIEGFLLPASAAHELVVAVNGRVVRDRLLSGAVNRALRGPSGALEADVFVHLRLPPEAVDANVHPAKAEVRFRDPGAVLSALANALAQARPGLHGAVDVRRVFVPDPARGAWQRPLSPVAWPSSIERLDREPGDSASWPSSQNSLERPGFEVRESGPEPESSPTGAPLTPLGRYIGQYRDTYLLLEDDEGLLLVDQHVAHERVLYERLAGREAATPVQRLLLPEVVDLSPALAALAEEVAPELAALGVEIEAASSNSVRVLGVPAALPPRPAGRLLERLLEELDSGAAPGASVRERAAASLACQAAIKKNRPLPRAEAEHLLQELSLVHEQHLCPHGRPIFLRLAHLEIERRIGRR